MLRFRDALDSNELRSLHPGSRHKQGHCSDILGFFEQVLTSGLVLLLRIRCFVTALQGLKAATSLCRFSNVFSAD